MGADVPGRRALSARTFLLRNPRRVVPLALITALVTALMVAVITPLNMIEETSEVYLRPLRTLTIVTPRLRRDFDDSLDRLLDANPAMDARRRGKMLWMRTPLVVGYGIAPLAAVDDEFQEDFLERLGTRLVEGHLPEPGTDGAAIHRAVLRARDMAIGDAFGQLVDPKDDLPGRFTVVGVLEGPARVGLVDLAYTSIPDYVLARRDLVEVVYAQAGRKAESDAWLKSAAREDGEKVFRVIDDATVQAELEESVKNLPVLVGFISGAVALIVALVTCLLHVITFQARMDEFALHLAVGQPRRRLLGKLIRETSAIALAGWLGGLALGIGVVALYKQWVLEPKGIDMRVFDHRPILYSASVPLLSAIASAGALAVRLRRVDPVAIIQRRGG